MGSAEVGRSIVLLGLIVVVLGLAIWFGPKLPWFGRLPGDISIERENLSIYAPVASMLVVSLVVTILLNLAGYLRK
jgi:hypothetical protein